MNNADAFFFCSVLANLHTTTDKKWNKRVIKVATTQKHDLVTPYIGMKVTRDNNMLMTSPTSSHVMFKCLWSFSLEVAGLICTSHITCCQDIIDLNK